VVCRRHGRRSEVPPHRDGTWSSPSLKGVCHRHIWLASLPDGFHHLYTQVCALDSSYTGCMLLRPSFPRQRLILFRMTQLLCSHARINVSFTPGLFVSPRKTQVQVSDPWLNSSGPLIIMTIISSSPLTSLLQPHALYIYEFIITNRVRGARAT
jgi:hypothetical protein